MKQSKKTIYAEYGIKFENGKIYSPYLEMWISPILVNGNAKLGKGVWTFSTLAGNIPYNVTINGNAQTVYGTCNCNCNGCYAQTGFYNMPSVKLSNAIKTVLARNDSEWLENAIKAQIKADDIKLLRIHASGDFFSIEYVDMWKRIISESANTVFWSYTKNQYAESAFDELPNMNMVQSIVKEYGLNFGHCDYIMDLYNRLQAENESVYICKCGIDKNQHCTNCKGCSKNKYVLFVEHSTAYNAESDAMYNPLKSIIESQIQTW